MYLFPFNRVQKGERIALYGMGRIGKNFRAQGVLVDPDQDMISFAKTVRPLDVCLNVAIGDIKGDATYYKLESSSALNSLDFHAIQNAKKYFNISDDIKEFHCRQITLQDLLDQYFDGLLPELLSLDVENYEMKVLTSALDSAFEKNVVMCIERSGLSPLIMEFAKSHGYFLYINTTGNHIFVKSDYRDKLLSV